MQVSIVIEQDNEAFSDGNNGSETARILRELADYCDGYDIEGMTRNLYDINGNRVGVASWNW